MARSGLSSFKSALTHLERAQRAGRTSRANGSGGCGGCLLTLVVLVGAGLLIEYWALVIAVAAVVLLAFAVYGLVRFIRNRDGG